VHSTHLLINISSVPESVMDGIGKKIQQDSDAWFSYFPGQWLVCSAIPFDTWLAWLTARVQQHKGSLMLLDLSHQARVSGVLPEKGWDWLRHHHFTVG